MSSSGLITKILGPDDQLKLVTELIEHDQLEQLLEICNISELDLSRDPQTIDNLFHKIQQRFDLNFHDLRERTDSNLNQLNEYLENKDAQILAQLIAQTNELWKKFDAWVTNKILQYILSNHKKLFDAEFYNEIMARFLNNDKMSYDIEAIENIEEFEIVYDLHLLESVYLFEDPTRKPLVSNTSDRLLLPLLSCNIETIATGASKLMRWRIIAIHETCNIDQEFDKLTWSLLKDLYVAGKEASWKQKNYLSFLLRILSDKKMSPELIKFVQTEQYWVHLQDSLNHTVHELRKLGLSILKLTIQCLSEGIDAFTTTSFHWDPSKVEEITETWKRFTTLYEIVALDTALNQLHAANADIIGLFDDATIYPSWGLILFSTGLMASMESVRKYTMSLVFEVRDAAVFSTNTSILLETILPSMMQAHYYNTDKLLCPYGDRVALFVCDILSQPVDEVHHSNLLLDLFKLLIKEGTSFDPARIYVSIGVLKFLEVNHANILSYDHLNLIKKLYEFESEDEVFQTTIQTIYLKFLLYVHPTIEPSHWIQTMVSHLYWNKGSYRYLSPLLDSFRDVAVSRFNPNNTTEQLQFTIGNEPTFDALTLILFDDQEVEITNEIIFEIIKSKEHVKVLSSEKVVNVLITLLSGTENDDVYLDSYTLADYEGFTASTWNSLNISPLWVSIRDKFSPEKFKFFVSIFKKMVSDSIQNFHINADEVLSLYGKITEYLQEFPKHKENFRVKDVIYGTYFDFLLVFLKINFLDEEKDELRKILNMVDSNIHQDNGNYLGNLGVTKICQFLLDTYVVINPKTEPEVDEKNSSIIHFIFDNMISIWDVISTDRLVLKERELYLSLLKTIFHPSILYMASLPIAAHGMVSRFEQYGKDIISHGFSRRGLLPLLGLQICKFMEKYGKTLNNDAIDYWWLIKIISLCFIQPQMSVNIFKLKPVIAHLFDKKLSLYFIKGSGLYEEVYGSEEISSRVLIINSMLLSSDYFKIQFISELVKRNNLLISKKRIDGPEETERLLLWELLLMCRHQSASTLDISKDIKDMILSNITMEEGSPLVRTYKEWFIAYNFAKKFNEKKATEIEDFIFELLVDHSKPIQVVSAEKICFLVLKALTIEGKFDVTRLLERFISNIVPNATSNKPLVRHFSNSLMLSFWPIFETSIKNATLKSILKNLFLNAQKTQLFGKYRAGDANIWDLYDDLTLVSIFGGVIRKITDHAAPYISEMTFKKYLINKDLFPMGKDENTLWLNKRSSLEATISGSEDLTEKGFQLQTKSGAWETVLDIDTKKSNEMVKRSDLIVVASLVDKPPNLGGICRLCDVLGVGLLTVQDIKVKNHPQFKNVAVTADRWMPMEEVPVDGIVEFMKLKKREGYSLIGLEQTDKSVKLDNDYRFPRKCLILLGTEAHGIPGPLLNELDLCLEIKQFGVIRSMNIQTATAVIVQSYTVQHM
ncbi:tRNA (guanosine(18)-2'-O)-methyltransferase NDAI_0B03380 [Naumovozyma dairenensis CBS 421]|uniref:tRNA/rRNA methyltransferase SpoU type domain-containing protein n=1 Tax=Naumovozyma dairenensis (strain ATCC 10597 / BCRC 20456 / CBS 421 / NBRC 0211 / NRRL Y-12639) TaxID=1071378 RepID=G0W6G1_NAUDC|nr:hypothetical protein NDAI_0B03380 [Naumovozyma dairenensis CBS 421]CCD23372.1 hypothetical protein NDAI_0B03380 [Naumovozyma dairenensis CBS 421]